ncbi:MAG: hypothetical protein WCO60_15100 [Verrucomicrobiota bacterium]
MLQWIPGGSVEVIWIQTPHLFEVQTQRRVDLGNFKLHPAYKREWRVDTHPRLSRDERFVCIDSPYTGQGRQLHLIDIADVVLRLAHLSFWIGCVGISCNGVEVSLGHF